MLQWPLPRERDEAVCHGTVRAVESLLVRVGRCRGALDVRIGEGLDALGTGDRVIRLGFSGTGDYARERLGIAASTAQKMARLARELRSRPLLRAAVREGRVSTSAAEAVVKVAQGEAEAFWVARARTETVRALEAAVKERGGVESEDDERWMRFRACVPPEGRRILDEAIDLAGKATCVTLPKWQRLEGWPRNTWARTRRPSMAPGLTAWSPTPRASCWNRPRSGWRRRARAGHSSTRSGRSRRPDRAWMGRPTRGASTRSCAGWRRCAPDGTRSSVTWRCSSGRWTAGVAWASPPWSTTARSGSGWARARSSSAPPWSGGSTSCRRSGRRWWSGGSRTRRRGSSPGTPTRGRSKAGSSAPGRFPASRCGGSSRATKRRRCPRGANSTSGCLDASGGCLPWHLALPGRPRGGGYRRVNAS